MSIITFVREALAAAKGPHGRLIGPNTRLFCSRADREASCRSHKQALCIVAVGADAFLAARLCLLGKAEARTSPRAAFPEGLTRRDVARAMRLYASTALIGLGPGKDKLLRDSGLDEAAWMHRWNLVFDYQPEDMRLFNDLLLPVGHGHGLTALTEQAARLIDAILRPDDESGGAVPMALADAVSRDVAAIWRLLTEEAGHALCH